MEKVKKYNVRKCLHQLCQERLRVPTEQEIAEFEQSESKEQTPTWYICPVNMSHYFSKVRRLSCPVCGAWLVML